MSHIDEGELTAYADGAYAPGDPVAQSVAEHIAECANCRNRLAAATALSTRAGEVLAYAAPTNLAAPPFEQVREAAHAQRKRSALFPAAWAASIVMALGLGWFAHSMTMPEQTKQVAVAPPVAAPTATPAPAENNPESVAPVSPAARVARKTPQTAAASGKLKAPLDAAAPVAADMQAGAPAGNVAAAELAQAAAPSAPPVGTHVIAGLPVVGMRAVGDSLIVEQKLPDGTIVTLKSTEDAEVQAFSLRARAQADTREANKSVAAPAAAAPPSAAASAKSTVVIQRGLRRIIVSGPLTLDSLRALAARIN